MKGNATILVKSLVDYFSDIEKEISEALAVG